MADILASDTAGILASDLLKQLGSISIQLAKQKRNLIIGVNEEVHKLHQHFAKVQEILNELGGRQVTDAAVYNLRDVYYMMDDVLDMLNTAMIRAEIEKEEGKPADVNAPAFVKKKVFSFFPPPYSCFNLPLHHDLGHKIKKLNKKFDEIWNNTEKYGIDFNRQPEVVERPQTTSLVDESDIIGRDRYRDELLSVLLGKSGPEERKPHVISLVGMGGLGKTTLAQIAYNHSEVQAHFDKRMWVCVSDPFDQCKVAKAIIESLEGQSPNTTELQSLLDKLYSLIGGERFFLVLDDVWTEDFTKWEPFRNTLKYGAEGSRILVTTRKTRVANMMESSSIIDLGVLSPNDSWLIIKKIAFPDDYGEQYRDLEDLGKQLANKCKGLPLAIKTMGRYMHGKRSKHQLERFLHNNLWEVEDFEEGLLGPLLLSYNELSLSEKQCFLFCAIFPKDHQFNRLELIINWMAQGYINLEGNTEMEDIAEEYFQKLAMCSFFQDFKIDENDGSIKSCKMHDIVHDFALLMTKNECFTINSDDEVVENFERARILSLKVKETFPELVYEAKNLHFLILDSLSSQTVLPTLFFHWRLLRTLILKDESIQKLPDEVEMLIHLRYLKLSCFDLKEFPETICNLLNLQSLDVRGCRELEKLPKGMSKLDKLRHLLLNDDCEIKSFPKGIGHLTSLRTLSYFSVGVESDEICKLGELKNLNHIHGSLKIQRLSNLVDLGEVKEAQLNKKTCLRVLCLNFDTLDENTKDRRMENDVLVLNALEPPPYLEEMIISNYKGTTMYPDGMMFLITLKKLVLSGCWNLDRLPPLGKLPFLKSVRIEQAYSLKKVGDEFLGIKSKNRNKKDYNDIIFPNLKSLQFEDLYLWEDWIGMGETREEEEEKDGVFVPIIIMPLLHSLSIKGCPNLKSLPDFLPTISLQVLEIGDYLPLHKRDDRLTAEEWSKISHIPNINIGYRYVQRDGHEVKSLLQASLIEKISHIQNIIDNR